MNSRERVIAALNHQQPDHVALDLGSNAQTGISASTLYKFRAACGLEKHPIRICEPMQMLGEVEADLIERLGVDIVPLWNRDNLFGLDNTHVSQPYAMSDGTPVLMPDGFQYDVDERGYTFVYPCGDRSARPSLQMPKDGFFFDSIERAPEIDEDHLTPLEDFQNAFAVRNELDCEHWSDTARRINDSSDLAIMGVLGGMGLGDAGEIAGPFERAPRGIRSISGWLEATVLYPDYVKAVFELQTETALKNLELYRQAVGERIQAIWLSGTDFGAQNAPLQSLERFRTLYKPYYQRVNDWIHANTAWKTFYHTCGAVETFIEDFIDMGMDCMNPVQCSAAGMDPQSLKDKYGKRITFWGAGVDTQKTLPRGTPQEVYDEATERIRIFSKDGGFIFASIHNIVAKVPPENLVAMYKAVADSR